MNFYIKVVSVGTFLVLLRPSAQLKQISKQVLAEFSLKESSLKIEQSQQNFLRDLGKLKLNITKSCWHCLSW